MNRDTSLMPGRFNRQDWVEGSPGEVSLEPTPEQAQFKKSISCFATGVVVLSCEDDEGVIHGMTANSFVSVSWQPLTVLVSLRPGKGSRILSRRGRYGASILDHDQQELTTHFSSKPASSRSEAFIARGRVPALRECLAWFECEIVERVQVHDHTMYVSHVKSCGNRQGAPLMFYASQYHKAVSAI